MSQHNPLTPKFAMAGALLALVVALCPTSALADELAQDDSAASLATQEQAIVLDDQAAVTEVSEADEQSEEAVVAPVDKASDQAIVDDEVAQDATDPAADTTEPDQAVNAEAQDATEEGEPAEEARDLASTDATEEAAEATPAAQDEASDQQAASESEPLLATPDETEPLEANKWTTGRWDVRKINGTYFRFWISQDGEAYKNGLVLPEWGSGANKAGYYAWARPDGTIVTGTVPYTDGTYVWLADNDGRLLNVGWNVTSYYTGSLQRYYIVDEGRHAAKVGLDTGSGAGNWAHYTLKDGYVLRGKYMQSSSVTYVADNDGKLPTTKGWVVTGIYDGGLQRYYISNYAAKTGFFTVDGASYRGIEGAGYVMRGYDRNQLAYANNDGKVSVNCWLVTNQFGHGFQRYWMGSDGLALRGSLVNAMLAGYNAYARPEGYVVRGKYVSGDRIYIANNDGKLADDGWVVTAAYGDGFQRYYINPKTHSAIAGYSTDGYAHYTLPAGYVLRGAYQSGEWVYLADNDGRTPTLASAGWIVSNKYGAGNQRYYLQKASNGAWAAKVGYSDAGYAHYTVEKTGHVLRNAEMFIDGKGWMFADNDGKLTKVASGVSAIIEKYLGWAIRIANDESHGYSQLDRWGPADYDCSSYVLSALEYAGLDIGNATYTGNMRSELCPRGWSATAYNGNPASLVRGDILLHDVNHVEFYLGNNKRIGAHEDEYGGIGYGAKPGDQTGQEICAREGVGNWFTWVLRLIRA